MIIINLLNLLFIYSVEVIRLGQSLWVNWDVSMYFEAKDTPALARCVLFSLQKIPSCYSLRANRFVSGSLGSFVPDFLVFYPEHLPIIYKICEKACSLLSLADINFFL